MGSKVGAIPSAVGGHAIQLSHVGTVFPDDRRRTWRAGANGMRYVHVDQIWVWGLFCFVGMFLNVNLATAIIPHGTDLQGLAAGAYQAEYLSKIWPGFWFLTLFNGFWILFKTQLGNTDILVRTVTDALWMSSQKARDWRARHQGDLLRHPRRLLDLGRHRHPLGVAVSALQDPREHGGHRPADRRRADLPGQPALPAEGRASAAVARDRPAGLLGASTRSSRTSSCAISCARCFRVWHSIGESTYAFPRRCSTSSLDGLCACHGIAMVTLAAAPLAGAKSDLGTETLAAGDGWAAFGTGTTGGAAASPRARPTP